jgi:hypothetical protein
MAIIFGGDEDKSYIEANAKGDTMTVALQKWGDDTIKKLRKSIRDTTSKGTSRNLEQKTVVLPIQFGQDKWVMSFSSTDYWKFINSGVQGVEGERGIYTEKTSKKGNVYFKKTGITQWANKAPSSPFSFKTKKPPVNFSNIDGQSLRQWAHNKGLNEYAVRESIFRQGIKATHFFDNVISKEWINTLVKRMAKAGGGEITLILSKDFK